MTHVLLELLWALLATLGFGVLNKAPIRDLPFAAFAGALAWGAYLAAKAATGSESLSFFMASITVGLFAEIAAAALKRPATLFIISAIIPLVPGTGMYRTMFLAVSGEVQESAAIGFQTLTVAGAIAAGLAVASAVARIMWLKKPMLRRRKQR